ncbi:hypothetical protein NCG97_02375 [Streptomyces lydicamycinicus]|uniref:hypothetical protein n=1 Tax=Streptomyces lydicamycinicus TaxID=1546107 RepID=UPI0020352D93|nr:hypothetical protein [Streptomyces lydicamycinicus]URZ99780.1 hypothetical protein NCG97_02375 [Streptomyces lydicamycinicus]
MPLALYGGEHDPVTSVPDLQAWNDLVTTPAPVQLFPGGHTYLQTETKALVDRLTETLDPALYARPVATA